MWQTKWNQIYLMSSLTFLCSFPGAFDLAHLLRPTIHVCLSTNTVKKTVYMNYNPKFSNLRSQSLLFVVPSHFCEIEIFLVIYTSLETATTSNICWILQHGTKSRVCGCSGKVYVASGRRRGRVGHRLLGLHSIGEVGHRLPQERQQWTLMLMFPITLSLPIASQLLGQITSEQVMMTNGDDEDVDVYSEEEFRQRNQATPCVRKFPILYRFLCFSMFAWIERFGGSQNVVKITQPINLGPIILILQHERNFIHLPK